MLITQRHSQALGSAQLSSVPVGRRICQAQTLVQLCTATHMPLFLLNPTFCQNILIRAKVKEMCYCLPLPPHLDDCVCKQSSLKGFICWTPLPCGPLSLCSAQTQSSGAQLTLITPSPYQTRGSMGISSHRLHRFKKQTRPHSTFMFLP